jgi:hypothetical protein
MKAMATGVVLNLGLHVSAFSQAAASVDAKQVLFNRRLRSFWAYFSVDRQGDPISYHNRSFSVIKLKIRFLHDRSQNSQATHVQHRYELHDALAANKSTAILQHRRRAAINRRRCS